MDGLVDSRWTKRRKIAANVAKDIANLSDINYHCPTHPTQTDYVTSVQNPDWPEHCFDERRDYRCDDFVGVVQFKDDGPDDHNMHSYNVLCDDAHASEYVEFELDDNRPSVFSDSEVDSDEDPGVYDLRFLLSCWAKKYDISHNALSALLEILRPRFNQLPRDARTLMKTARTEEIDPFVKHVSNGEYYHFGITEGITKKLFSHKFQATSNDSISIQINVDGVPLFKSTGGQFWPILGKIDTPLVTSPFVIGIFYGVNKPCNLDFLTDFIEECRELQEHGVACGNVRLNFRISVAVCDAPARAFLKSIKGHTAYSGCERCVQRGVWNAKMTFPEVNAETRTNISFDEMKDPDHHQGRSPLTDLGIGMVTQFVLEYMHLVCLGVVRRLIWLWISGPVVMRCRLGAKCITSVSQRLISLRSFMPCEFSRKPRSLSEWQRWKATEFRQFLLYTGPIALLGKLPESMYNNFMLLSVGIFLLLNKTSSVEDIEYAQQLLVLFVQHFSDLYGSDMLVYNIHNLIHLADDARYYGPLDNVSAFCFENFLGRLVKLVRKPSRPLQQVVRRLLEQNDFCIPEITKFVSKPQDEHNGNVPRILGICKQYKKITTHGICISLKPGDNCITLGRNIVIVCNIVVKDCETLLLFQKFCEQQNFFSYPCESSRFGIYQVSCLQSQICLGKLDDFQTKNVLLPLPSNDSYVVIPLLHV